ncbi:MAG: SAM-dependent chlorinase/fluorinase [Anaerolineales bacterium]|nr:SAM-dependent chlorinase/fluorinase [Anaerolineales bacterium]
MTPIAIVTDFGITDSYVGEMKGIISGIAPHAALIDVTHAIPYGDIRAAAFALWRSFDAFPPGTIFLVVVDPGVGTNRRPIAIRIKDRTVVCPDNGILTYLLFSCEAEAAVELANPAFHAAFPSRTFHGRDIFSPAAAHLAAGIRLDELGPYIDSILRLQPPHLTIHSDRCEGEILQVDRFGNLTTSIGILKRLERGLQLQPWSKPDDAHMLEGPVFRVILPDHRRIPLHDTFADAAEGETVAYIGSAGLLEIAVCMGSAALAFELKAGAHIILERKK